MEAVKAERKRYDKEFKINAVKLSMESGRTTASVARELGIDVTTLYVWQREYRQEIDTVKSGITTEEELRRMKRRNMELEEEVAILKKAMGYFSAVKK